MAAKHQIFDSVGPDGWIDQENVIENSTVTPPSGHQDARDHDDNFFENLLSSVRAPSSSENRVDLTLSDSGISSNSSFTLESEWNNSDYLLSSPELSMMQSQDNNVNQFPSSEPVYELQMSAYPDIDPQLVLMSPVPSTSNASPASVSGQGPSLSLPKEQEQNIVINIPELQDNTVNQFPSSEPVYELQMSAYPEIDPQIVLVSPVPSTSNASPASVSGPDPAASPALDNSSLTLPKEQEQKMVFNIQESQDNNVNQFPSSEPVAVYELQMSAYPEIDPQLVLVSSVPSTSNAVHTQQEHSINNSPVIFNDGPHSQMVSGTEQFIAPDINVQPLQATEQPTPWKRQLARVSASCEVCGGKATGFHYSVMTCEGCKLFFRRAIVKEKVYRCKKAQNCILIPGNRKNCQKCRLDKCRKSGMDEKLVQRD